MPPTDMIPEVKTNKSIITSNDNKKDRKWLRIAYNLIKIRIKISTDETFKESKIKKNMIDMKVRAKIIIISLKISYKTTLLKLVKFDFTHSVGQAIK